MLTSYILIQLNGCPFNCAPNLSLKDLLIYLEFDVNSVIVEYNHEIVQAVAFSDIFIASGDKIEVLAIVGGG